MLDVDRCKESDLYVANLSGPLSEAISVFKIADDGTLTLLEHVSAPDATLSLVGTDNSILSVFTSSSIRDLEGFAICTYRIANNGRLSFVERKETTMHGGIGAVSHSVHEEG